MANFPTLSNLPSYPLQESREDSVLRSEFEGGYEQTRAQFTRVRRKWDVSYSNLTTADKNTLDAFIDTVNGGADAFNWTHPVTSTVYSVRFSGLPVYSHTMPGYWDVRFSLNQV